MSHTATVSDDVNHREFTDNANGAARALGIKPITPEKTLSLAAAAFEKAVAEAFPGKWKEHYPNVPLPAGHTDFGFMAPLDALAIDPPNPTIVAQVKNDMKLWKLPVSTEVAQEIARTICMEVRIKAGLASWSVGSVAVTSYSNIVFLVIYGIVPVTAKEPGVFYMFGAALQQEG